MWDFLVYSFEKLKTLDTVHFHRVGIPLADFYYLIEWFVYTNSEILQIHAVTIPNTATFLYWSRRHKYKIVNRSGRTDTRSASTNQPCTNMALSMVKQETKSSYRSPGNPQN